MARYDVNNYTVETLLSSIKSGNIAIPEMQRPFVWDSSKVRDLVDSLYKGFPVGYIIVWQNPEVKLKDGTKATGKKVLIDGQQRMTAMAAAIVGQEVLDDHYKWRRIAIAFNPLEEKFEVVNNAILKSPKWIPDIAPVLEPAFDTFSFVMDYCKKNEIQDQMSQVNNIINRLRAIQNNSLGVITLAEDLDIDSVTEIFIRINSKGVVLSQADFAMSKISSNETYGGNITRKTIDYFCHLLESPEDLKEIKNNDHAFAALPEFDAIKWAATKNKPIYKTSYTDILRVAFTYKFKRGRLADLVSLLSGRDFETREFRTEIEEESFQQLHEAVLQAVNQTNYERYLMIVRSTGIVRKSLIRSQNVLNFGYALYLALRERKVDSNKIEQVVRRWLALTILTGRYSGSPESSFDYDIKRFAAYDDPMEFLKITEAGELSDAFWNVNLVQRLNTSVASSPYFNMFLIAQVKNHDKGFLSVQVDVEAMLENRGDIHHLFPKKYLTDHGVPQAQYNQIANYVFLQQEINVKISDAAPSVYMKKVYEQCQTKAPVYGGIVDLSELRANLEQNCIPDGFEEMSIADYDTFLEKRRVLMAKKIRDYYFSL
ncbi:GmrSD restriction endonuclease domain-containing protein [Paenibacillus sp.]